jgi:hypothetical protein
MISSISRALVALFTLALFCTAAGYCQTTAQQVDELLWWLPPDTETVEVMQVPTVKHEGPLYAIFPVLRGHVDFGDLSYGELSKRHLAGAKVKAVVEGSRHFRAPSGLGEMPHDGARIYIFGESMGPAGNALMADLLRAAAKVEEVEGLRVAVFRDRLENDVWTTYVTVPRPDLLVVATDRDYLTQVLRRAVKHDGERALPEELPEWKWIDRDAPYWALRHYRREYSATDPTSPFLARASANVPDPRAVGLAASVDAGGRSVVVHYLSGSTDAEQVAKQMYSHPGDGVTPEIRRATNDAIEIRYTSTRVEELQMFYFYLMAALGHAVYL